MGEDYALNSLFGISFVVTQTIYEQGWARECHSSQFPFWDFFCCNMTIFPTPGKAERVYALNSLFGISFVVTYFAQVMGSEFRSFLSIPFLGFLLL